MKAREESTNGVAGARPLDCLLAGVAGFGLAGLLIGRLTLRTSPNLHQDAGDTAFLLLSFSLSYAALGAVVGGISATALAAIRALFMSKRLTRILAITSVSVLLLAPVLYAVALPDMGLAGDVITDLVFGSGILLLSAVVVCLAIVLGALGWAAQPVLAGLASRFGRSPRLLVAEVVLVLGLLLSASSVVFRPNLSSIDTQTTPFSVDQVSPAESAPDPVVLLNIDGAELEAVILPMVAAGELPTFSRLMREGTWGGLATFEPTRSPSIWTSLVTGKEPAEHGIRNFTTFRIPGLSNTVDELPLHTGLNELLPAVIDKIPGAPPLHLPYTSTMRNVEALWNIVSNFYPVGVYRWLVTWRADPVDGFFVAGGMRNVQFVVSFREQLDRPMPEGAVHPPDVFDGLSLPERVEIGPEDLEPYGEGVADRESRWFKMLVAKLQDPTVRVLPMLIDKYRPRFTAAGFYEVDSVQHLRGRFWGKENRYANALPESYRFTDQRLGEFLGTLGEDVNVLVVSDHGYDFAKDNHVFAPPGIFLARGPAFDAGRTVDALSVFDIAPLVLRLLQLPLPEDMPGTVSGAYALSLSKEFLEAHPERRIPTYEAGQARSRRATESNLDEEIIDLLRSLGYIQ